MYAGLAAEAARALATLERVLDRRLATIHACGGGAQDALLCSLIAEASGKALVVGPLEATAWGNALVQFVGLGVLPSLEAGRRVVERSVPQRHIAPEAADAGR